MKKKVELLAPAGNKEQFIAAVENGADAVYTGGRFLNARQAAEGLSDEDMALAVGYAHLRGVKVYVTMNTLVSDDELEEGLEYAEFLYECGVDAVIIQDLGLGRYIHERIPDFEMHLSTQASAVGAVAVSAAASLGYKRVITARELTLSEIRAACANGAGAEVEVFCHGALCICYSGQCQLSRYNGGRSGNRGVCAQPCRLQYRTLTRAGSVLTDGIPDYPLSPKDLCTIDGLGELIRAGVASLKIEGRLKTPEYVAVVTRIYRKYIDKYYENGYYTVSREDREALTQIFSRGGSCSGYIDGKSGRELISGDLPKNRGIKVGTVVGRGKNDRQVVVRLNHVIETGDGIEIHGKELLSNIVTYIRVNDDGTTTIGDFRGTVSEGDGVYRTSSKQQLKEARATFKDMDFGSTGKRRLPVTVSMNIVGSGLVLRAEAPDGTFAECWREVPESVGQGEGSGDRFMKALGKTGGTPFEAADIQISDEVKDLSMKVSEINEMRRSVLSELKDKIRRETRREPSAYFAEKEKESKYVEMKDEGEGAVLFSEHSEEGENGKLSGNGAAEEKAAEETAEHKSPEDAPTLEEAHEKEDEFWETREESMEKSAHLGKIELYFLDWNDFAGFRAGGETAKLLAEKKVSIVALIPLVDVIRNASKLGGVRFKPYISAICKGREDNFLKDNFQAVQAVVKQTGCYVGNLDWITPLVKRGMKVYADYGLNVYNGETVKALEELGVSDFCVSLEKEDKNSGKYPLMTLEHIPDGDALIDMLDRKFIIRKRDFSSQAIIRPDYASEEELFEEFSAAVKKMEETGAETVRIYI